MAHMQKLKLCQVAPLHRHNTREMQATRERENVDETRTHLNYCVGEEGKESWQDHIHDCIELHNSHGRNIRSDAVVAVSWVITCPKNFPQERQRAFFTACYLFLAERYGLGHLDRGYVHLDETQAHMHTQIDAYNDKTGRLQARDLFTRADLKTFHSDLEAFLCQELHMERVGVTLTQEERTEREMDYTDMPTFQAVLDEKKELQVKLTSFKQPLPKKRKSVRERLKQRKEASTEREELESEIASLEQDVTSLQSKKESLNETAESLNKEIASLKQSAISLPKELSQLQKQLSELESA
jgi:hypothetical protein